MQAAASPYAYGDAAAGRPAGAPADAAYYPAASELGAPYDGDARAAASVTQPLLGSAAASKPAAAPDADGAAGKQARRIAVAALVLAVASLAAALAGLFIAPLAMPVSNIAEAAVGPSQLADDAVTAAKVAPYAVGPDALANDAVTAAKIAPQAVGTPALAPQAVTWEKLASEAVDATVLANQAVTNSKIANGAVTSSKIASGVTLYDAFLMTPQIWSSWFYVLDGGSGRVHVTSRDLSTDDIGFVADLTSMSHLGNSWYFWTDGYIENVYNLRTYTVGADRATLATRHVTLAPVDAGRLAARFKQLSAQEATATGATVLVAEDLLAAFPEAAPEHADLPARDAQGEPLPRKYPLAVNKEVVYDAAVALLPSLLRRLDALEARLAACQCGGA